MDCFCGFLGLYLPQNQFCLEDQASNEIFLYVLLFIFSRFVGESNKYSISRAPGLKGSTER